MNWFEKQRILNIKNLPKQQLLKDIINNSEFKKLSDYDKLVYHLASIEDYSLLSEIEDILSNKSFTHCKTFPLIFPEIVKMDNLKRMEYFGGLIKYCFKNACDLKFKLYIFFKFLDFDNREKEKKLYELISSVSISCLDYEKIVSTIFKNDNIEWIENFISTFCPILDKYGYNDDLFDRLVNIKNIECLRNLSDIIYCHYDNEYINKLIDVKNIERLNLIAEVAFDDDLKRTEHYNYIVDMMFNSDAEKLNYLVDIALDCELTNLGNYKEIMEFIFSIKDEVKLLHIHRIITNYDSIHFGKVVDKAIKIDDIELLGEFNLIINKVSDKDVLKVLELDFENNNIIQIIRKINEIFSIIKADIILTKEEILNIVFNKILVVENYDNMLLLLEELVRQINLYSADSLRVSNSIKVNSIIDEKINGFKGKQLVKNMKCENQEA